MIYTNGNGVYNFWLANAIATVGDVGLFMNVWIFTRQYIEASINLPIIITMFDEDSIELDKSEKFGQVKKRAKTKVRIFDTIFGLMILTWFIASLTTGLLAVRSQGNWLLAYQVIIMLWSMCKLMSLIKRISSDYGPQ